MKKTFAILSILFATTYANNDMSGYTESIIIKPQLLGSSTKYSDEYKATEDLPQNPYKGTIEEYDWEKMHIIPDITESSEHKYGFDGLTKECYIKNAPDYCFDSKTSKVPTVHISIKTGETAYFNINTKGEKLDLKPYEDLILLHEKQFVNVEEEKYKELHVCIDAKKIAQKEAEKGNNLTISGEAERKIEVKTIEDGGIYTICAGNTKKPLKPVIRINVIPYDEIDPKKFMYLQLDGGETDINKPATKYPNALTKEKVDTYVKDVFKQAVVEVQSFDGLPTLREKVSKDINDLEKKIEDPVENTFENIEINLNRLSKINELKNIENIEINMADITNAYSDFKNNIKTIMKYLDIYNKDTDPDKTDITSERWHFVIAINKIRKKWPLNKCLAGREYNISSCEGFKIQPEDEYNGTEFYIKSSEGCRADKGTIPWPIKIRITTKETESKRKEIESYKIFDDVSKSSIPLKECDTLFTDNAYPKLPFNNGIYAANYPIGNKLKNGYLPYGSVIVVPRGIGESANYAVVHELGHSYGLTDVTIAQSTTTTTKEETSTEGWKKYTNDYATQETNVMSWHSPVGKKIRYRGVPIAYTGGRDLTIKFFIKPGGDLCTKKDTEVKGRCEEIIETLGLQEKTIKGNGENQWKCIRNCYTKGSSDQIAFWKNQISGTAAIKTDNVTIFANSSIGELIRIHNIPLETLKPYFELKQLKDYFTLDDLAKSYDIEELEKFYDKKILEAYYSK